MQARAMSDTDILITPCGGTGTVLTFLEPGSSAIVMNYYVPAKNSSVQMEALYYWQLEYLDLTYFPVLAEDYENTSDRPACEKPPGDPWYEEQVSKMLLISSIVRDTRCGIYVVHMSLQLMYIDYVAVTGTIYRLQPAIVTLWCPTNGAFCGDGTAEMAYASRKSLWCTVMCPLI